MKYTLIHCYSDYNKGDLGIILTTVDMLKENDASADIEGVSTYNFSDPSYHTQHNILKKTIKVLPSIFGELNIFKYKTPLAKSIRLIFDICRLLVFLIFPIKFRKLRRVLFSKVEQATIDRIELSDYIISKGGSFLCNEKDLRSKFLLTRYLFIFFLSFKLRKKVIILCQSLGPVYGEISRIMLNYVLSKCFKIVLRESQCINQYRYLKIMDSKLLILNDIAFYLNTKNVNLIDLNIDKSRFNIGITIKHVDKNKAAEYRHMMIEAIKHCIDVYNTVIYIFPHVTIDDDIDNSFEIFNSINDKYKSRITIFNGNYTSAELKVLYSLMNIFIGTRLHSTIFAMGEMVPSICISYHGTKALGIFSNYGLGEYVILEYSSNLLINKIDALIANQNDIRNTLQKMHDLYKVKFESAFKDTFVLDNNRRDSGR